MNYRQTYKYREDGLGWLTVLFVISDNYNELYAEEGINTDIFLLENIKQDLNTDEGSFAIDELAFRINQAACVEDNDIESLFFTLDASAINVNRYCALFFGEQSVENMVFIGKINSKISGSDIKWNSKDYEFEIDPIREYQFTALSFDISILEEAKISSNIYKIVNGNQVKIDNVRERWLSNDKQAYKDIFKHRLFFGNANNIHANNIHTIFLYQYFTPLGNLYDIIKQYLLFTTQIVNEKLNIPVGFTLLESELGIGLQPVTCEPIVNNRMFTIDWTMKQIAITNNIEISPDSSKSVLINYKMIDPYVHSVEPAIANIAESIANNNRQYSFLAYDNVGDLLFAIARSFACYIRASYTNDENINIEFTPRKGIVETDYTYIIGTEEADFNTSSIIVNKKNMYFSVANSYAKSGYDIIIEEQNGYPIISKELEQSFKSRDIESRRAAIEYEQILFSVSPTLYSGSNRKLFALVEPLNSRYYNRLNENWDEPEIIKPVGRAIQQREYLHTSLYVELPQAPENDVNTFLNGHKVVRPASGVIIKIGGDNMAFHSMEDYVNAVMARDKQYYETEYNLTVPYWSGFSKNSNGNNPSWQNIQLGSKIKLSEIVKRYINNNWVSQRVTRDYVVVSIERNLQKPETKLKLHSLERFAYGYWDGALEDLPIETYARAEADKFIGIDYVEYEIHEEASPVNCGDAVMIVDNNKIARTINVAEYYGKTIGIALEDGEAGDLIKVQIGGRVVCNEYNFDEPTGQVFARINNYGLNVTEILLPEEISTENMVIILGRKVSNNSFILDIQEFIHLNEVIDA